MYSIPLQSHADGGVDEPVVQVAVAALVAVAVVVELTVDVDEEALEVVGQRQTGVEVEGHAAVEGSPAYRCYAQAAVEPVVPLLVGDVVAPEARVLHQLRYVGAVAEGFDLVDEGEHGHGKHADEQSAHRHPVVGIAHAHAALPQLHPSQAVHHVDEVAIGGRGVVDVGVVVHGAGHQRPCRPLLQHRLVVGCRIGESLAVEQVVAVGDEGAHLDGAGQLHLPPFVLVLLGYEIAVHVEVGRVVLKRVYAQVDAVGTARGSQRQVAALVAAHVHGVAQAVASVARPQSDVVRRLGLQVGSRSVLHVVDGA